MKDKITWNVFRYNMSTRKVEPFDVFNHSNFYHDCMRAYLHHKNQPEKFNEAILKSVFYHFWSKSEHEVYIGGWSSDVSKVDIAEQLKMNWNNFVAVVHARMFADSGDLDKAVKKND